MIFCSGYFRLKRRNQLEVHIRVNTGDFHIVNYLPALMPLLLHKKDKYRDAAELGLDEFSKLAKIKGTRSS
jgi:uncharacterized RmlC-like cupin family protein